MPELQPSQPKKKLGRRPTLIQLDDGTTVSKSKHPDYFKNYFDINKDKIYRKVTCECGLTTSYNNMTNHKKSKKHLNRMRQQ